MFGLTEVNMEEEEFGAEETEDAGEAEDEQETQGNRGSGITKIKDEKDIHLLTSDKTCLVYQKCILKLASCNVGNSCKATGCTSPVSHRTENIGSALYIFWVSLLVFFQQNQLLYFERNGNKYIISDILFILMIYRNVAINMRSIGGAPNQF